MSSKKSGDGERTAMLGYVPQYKIAAMLIYDALVDGTLDWFRVADPDVGQVDDIQIATSGCINAYQVKWAEFSESFTFNKFIQKIPKPNGIEKSSLFEQLVSGWKILRYKYPERLVKVHLLTRHQASASNSKHNLLPMGVDKPKYTHFQAFVKDCWLDRSWLDGGIDNCPSGWSLALEKLQEISELDSSEFVEFMKFCELEFNYKLPDQRLLSQKRQSDIDAIYCLLTEMAGGDIRIIHMERDGLIKRLGWESRFKLHFIHEFPVDYAYQPISKTIEDLETILSNNKNGYIALVGTPGSGKSTTLTHTLRYKKGYRLVRYYAFVPDSPSQARGEANNFLHDLTTSLSNIGFRGELKHKAESRDDYLRLLSAQLVEANEKWQSDNIVTLIMIDGLDHIQREHNPQRSLLADLPHPSTVPEGVLFILGSQTLQLDDLSDAIRKHVENNSRKIEMSPLKRKEAHLVINKWPIGNQLSFEEKEKLFLKSQGHPLSLIYYLSLLTDNQEYVIDDLIDSVEPYKGHIDDNYSIYWSGIENDEGLFELFALLARIRIPISTKEISNWFDAKTVNALTKNASHYFRKDISGRWNFFHNSFRQFILDMTGRNAFGETDFKLNIKFHEKLAQLSSTASEEGLWKWEQIYHFFESENWSAVIEIGTQDYFRRQFYGLRHVENIYDDITFLMLSAKKLLCPIAIVRAILIETELRERREILGQVNILKLLYNTSGTDLAIDYAMDGRRLRVTDEEALSFANYIITKGEMNLAKDMFAAAEPLAYLSGSEGVGTNQGGKDVLKMWVKVAHYFVGLDDIFNAIFQTKYDHSRLIHGENEKEANNSLHFALIHEVCHSILNGRNIDKIYQLISVLSQNADYHDHLIDLCYSICLKNYPPEMVNDSIDRIMIHAENGQIDDSEKLLIAEILLRRKDDSKSAKQMLSGIKQPVIHNRTNTNNTSLSPFYDRMRLNRLLSALNLAVEPVSAVPDSDNSSEKGDVLFARMVVVVANIWGKAWRDNKPSPSSIVRELKPAFDIFLKDHKDTNEWHSWYVIRGSAVEYYKLAISACKQHGIEYVNALSEAFLKHWNEHYWPTTWRHDIACALHEACNNEELLEKVLDEVMVDVDTHDDVHSRIEEYTKLAISYAKIGKKDKARDILPKLLKGSFAIWHHKDRQFSHWVSWLEKQINNNSPEFREDISRFSYALVNLELTGQGRGTQEAALDLIKIVTIYDPAYAFYLVTWLFDRKGLDYSSAITGFLQGLLERQDPLLNEIVLVTSKLLIPFEEYNPSELAESLAYKSHLLLPENEAVSLLSNISQSITIHALPSNRRDWWKGLMNGVKHAGRDGSIFCYGMQKAPKDHYSDNDAALVTKSGEKLTNEEAQLKVNTVADLFGLLKNTKSTKYFRWMDLIDIYLDKMNVKQLVELNELINQFGKRNDVICSIASRLVVLDEKESANKIVSSLLDLSQPHGWDVQWDGGSRQKVFRALVEIDSETWRPRAIETLVNDYIGEFRYPASLIWNIEEIVEILFEDTDLSNVWEEIKNHIYQLSCFSDENIIEPLLNNTVDKKSDIEVLINFVFYISDVSIPELQNMAHQTIVALISECKGTDVFMEDIAIRMQKVGLSPIQMLSILNEIALSTPDFAKKFIKEIQELCISNDLIVRKMALKVASKIGLNPNKVPGDRENLPFIYTVELPKINDTKIDPVPIEILKPGETLPDYGDSLEMVRPFDAEARLISKMSSVPLENVLYSAVNFMRRLVPETDWNRAAEEKFRRWMEGISLKLAYRRCRPQVAIMALSYVACELYDADYIDEQSISFLEKVLRRSDSHILIVQPSARPNYITVQELENKSILRNNDEWIKSGGDSLSLLHIQDTIGNYVLGEVTQWSWLDWQTPTELRMSMVCHPDWPDDETSKYPEHFFPYLRYWAADDYPHIGGINEPSLLIYGSPGHIDLGGAKWLALNPVIGENMGWLTDDTGLFRWVNNSGELMVESITWKDGPIDRQPPKMDDICSNGWLVIATPKAVDEIKNKLKEFIKIDIVVRSYGRDSYSPTSEIFENRCAW